MGRMPPALDLVAFYRLKLRNGMMAGVRMDKWLWAARFFKTRTLATRACDLGRISFNGQPAKPAREVHVGDRSAGEE